MNSEESRLRTFANWPENAVVDARRVATAGFYYMGQGQEVQCFSCGGRISEWNFGDSIMGRHIALDPYCPFVLNPALSGNIPLLSERRNTPNTSQEQSVFHNERARLETFATWPVRTIVSPELLAKSGFYYTQVKDKVRCAYCNGYVEKWEEGDDPDIEHRRHFPDCSFIKNKFLIDMNVTDHSGVAIRQNGVDSGMDTLKELGVQDHRIPRHSKLVTYDARLNTFSQWPPSLTQKPHDLAEAGFYFTGKGDQVRCFHCDGGLRLWERDDDPWLEHARWFPSCGFILLVKGQEFVDEATSLAAGLVPPCTSRKTRSESPIRKVKSVTEEELQDLMITPNVISALQMGIEASRIKQALRHRLQYVGTPFPTPDALVVAALEAQTEQTASADIDNWVTPPDSPSPRRCCRPAQIINIDHGASTSEGEMDNNEREIETEPPEEPIPPPNQETSENVNSKPTTEVVSLSLEEENRRLKEARLCKICMDFEVGVVFLPCRHLVTCYNCAHSLADCPLCRQPIKATVRTYLS